MKKNTRLDTKAFVLIETLLVSLTIAGILLYMYVQYARITDSYHRLSRYNSVESLYRTSNIKRILLMNVKKPFYDKVKSGSGIYQITRETKIEGSSISLPEWREFWDDMDISILYITKGNANLNNLEASFSPFIKTISTDDGASYRIIVKYGDGNFATISFKEATNI